MAEPTQVARLRSGDPAALADAVGHYQNRLYRYLLRLVRDQASADDMFQQTWLHVVRQLHRYDAARSFDTWQFAIAHNAAMDLLRRRPGESLEDHEFSPPKRAPDALSAVLDARRRGMRYVMWTLLAIFLTNGIGVILYFILRDPLLVYCSRCGAGVQPSHAFCPRCGAGVQPACQTCHRTIQPGWTHCAWCGGQL